MTQAEKTAIRTAGIFRNRIVSYDAATKYRIPEDISALEMVLSALPISDRQRNALIGYVRMAAV